MNKLSIKQLDNAGIDFSGSEPSSEFLLEHDDNVSYPNDVFYDLHASLVSNGILVAGSIKTSLKCRCGRCLEEYDYKVAGEVCHFYEIPDKPEIDLTPELREDIIIGLPQNFICRKDCKGLCPVCGENRNIIECNCDNNISNNDVWRQLDNLVVKKSQKD